MSVCTLTILFDHISDKQENLSWLVFKAECWFVSEGMYSDIFGFHVTDNDDFVIPSFSVEESDLGDWEASRTTDPQPPPKVLF